VKIARIDSGADEAEERDVVLEADHASIGGRAVAFSAIGEASALRAIEIEGQAVAVRTARDGDRVFVWCGGRVFEFRTADIASRPSRPPGRSHAADSSGLISPMPGRVRKVLVVEGAHVRRGEVLLILEAMKMEHAIRAPRDGRVAKLLFAEGDLVDAGVALAEID
jgi:3-methylcrotonyl-CoA carboxylase alpha subunit